MRGMKSLLYGMICLGRIGWCAQYVAVTAMFYCYLLWKYISKMSTFWFLVLYWYEVWNVMLDFSFTLLYLLFFIFEAILFTEQVQKILGHNKLTDCHSKACNKVWNHITDWTSYYPLLQCASKKKKPFKACWLDDYYAWKIRICNDHCTVLCALSTFAYLCIKGD